MFDIHDIHGIIIMFDIPLYDTYIIMNIPLCMFDIPDIIWYLQFLWQFPSPFKSPFTARDLQADTRLVRERAWLRHKRQMQVLARGLWRLVDHGARYGLRW